MKFESADQIRCLFMGVKFFSYNFKILSFLVIWAQIFVIFGYSASNNGRKQTNISYSNPQPKLDVFSYGNRQNWPKNHDFTGVCLFSHHQVLNMAIYGRFRPETKKNIYECVLRRQEMSFHTPSMLVHQFFAKIWNFEIYTKKGGNRPWDCTKM